MTTTSYNHATLGTATKPLILNADFKGVVEALNEGNALAYDEAISRYSFEPYQKQFLEHKYNELCRPKK